MANKLTPMNKILRIATVCALLLPVASAYAGKNKNRQASGEQAKGDDTFARFDTNHNGVLDDSEKPGLLAAFASGDASLKKYDTNSDGKLDENEIAAIQPAKKSDYKKKKKKKK